MVVTFNNNRYTKSFQIYTSLDEDIGSFSKIYIKRISPLSKIRSFVLIPEDEYADLVANQKQVINVSNDSNMIIVYKSKFGWRVVANEEFIKHIDSLKDFGTISVYKNDKERSRYIADNILAYVILDAEEQNMVIRWEVK